MDGIVNILVAPWECLARWAGLEPTPSCFGGSCATDYTTNVREAIYHRQQNQCN